MLSKIDAQSEKLVKFVSVPIRRNDAEFKSDWPRYSTALKTVKTVKPDIFYLSADAGGPPRGQGILRILKELIKESIVITGAKTFQYSVAPPAFPAECVITASQEGGPQGSLLEFVTTSKYDVSYAPEEETPLKENWIAAADTVAIALATLFKAQELGNAGH